MSRSEVEKDKLRLETLRHRAYLWMQRHYQVKKKLDAIAAQLAQHKLEDHD